MNSYSLADALRFYRAKRAISARHLSLAAGLSPSYVGKIEAGEIRPSFASFCALVKALEMTDAEILFLIKLTQEGC